MTYSALIRHWMGMPPDQITAQWTADPATLDDVLAAQHRRLVKSVLAAIERRARVGEIAAVKWLEDRRSTGSPCRGSPDLSQHSFAELQGIVEAATNGDVEAAEWLQSKGLLGMSLKKE